MTKYGYVQLYITMYDHERENLEGERGREREKSFSRDSNVLKLFILLNKPQLCLHLFTFVYLCSNDASMHKFCACFILFPSVINNDS